MEEEKTEWEAIEGDDLKAEEEESVVRLVVKVKAEEEQMQAVEVEEKVLVMQVLEVD